MSYDGNELNKHFNTRDPLTVNGTAGTYRNGGSLALEIITDKGVLSFDLKDIVTFPEFEVKKAQAAAALKQLIDDGAQSIERSQWSELSPSSGPVLACLKSTSSFPILNAFFFGNVTYDKHPTDPLLTFCVDAELQKKYDDVLQSKYDPLWKWGLYGRQVQLVTQVEMLYLLRDVVKTASVPAAQSPESTLPACSPESMTLWFDTASDLDNDLLPDMTGFEPDTLGAAPYLWRSPGYLLADRDLEVGERLHAWAVRASDGRVVKAVALTADKDNKGKAQWPAAFLGAVNAAPDAKEGGKRLCAGRLVVSGGLGVGKDGSPATTALATMSAAQKADLNRLWCYGEDHRLFTNAPFSTNQVSAIRLPDMALADGDSVVVQVRDRTTQHLYETHLFTPLNDAERDTAVWPMKCCAAINARNQLPDRPWGMVRAGVLESDGVTVKPAKSGNRLWVPQCSDLSVEVDAVTWRRYRTVGDFTPTVGATLHFFLYDQYSSAQLTGSSFSYTVKQSESDAATCLASLAIALQASALGVYLRLGGMDAVNARPDTASGWTLWQVSLPVRVIVIGVPGLTGEYERALKTTDGKDLALGELYEIYKEGLTLTLTEQWGGQVIDSWDFSPEQIDQESCDKWCVSLVRSLMQSGEECTQFIEWGEEGAGDVVVSDSLEDMKGVTLWLPMSANFVWSAVARWSRELGEELVLPRVFFEIEARCDRLICEELFMCLANRCLGITHGVEERRVLWGVSYGYFYGPGSNDVFDRLMQEASLYQVSGDVGSVWNYMNKCQVQDIVKSKTYSIPSNIVASMQASNILLGLQSLRRCQNKDLWKISMGDGYWMDCISCTRSKILIGVSIFEEVWYPLIKVCRLIELVREAELQGFKLDPQSKDARMDECKEILGSKFIRTALQAFVDAGVMVDFINALVVLFDAVGEMEMDAQVASIRTEQLSRALSRKNNAYKFMQMEIEVLKVQIFAVLSSRGAEIASAILDDMGQEEKDSGSIFIESHQVEDRFNKWFSDARQKVRQDRQRIDNELKQRIEKFLQSPRVRQAFVSHDVFLQRRLIIGGARACVGTLQLDLTSSAAAQGISFVCFNADLSPENLSANPVVYPGCPHYERSGGVGLYIPHGVVIAPGFSLACARYISRAGVSVATTNKASKEGYESILERVARFMEGSEALMGLEDNESILQRAARFIEDNEGLVELEDDEALMDLMGVNETFTGKTLQMVPPITGQPFIPSDSLCVDYSTTQNSEVYDVTGASVNGVDPRTGLFHAHYPMGVVRGLEGKGPDLDLTLHYSATRANESALGDGWAFRFSVYDNFLQRLTLSTGQTLTLTAEHCMQASGDKQLAINGVVLTGVRGSAFDMTELTILYPSGRREHLAKPAKTDDVEAGGNYRKECLDKLKELKVNLEKRVMDSDEAIKGLNEALPGTKAVASFERMVEGLFKVFGQEPEELSYKKLLDLTSERNQATLTKWEYKKQLARVIHEISVFEVNAYSLVPDSIVSPHEGNLTLAWEAKLGHVRLSSVSDGINALLKAAYDDPVASGKYNCTFTFRPETDEAYEVKLAIEDCLLRSVIRQDKGQVTQQKVVFGYEMEASLDRVLCSVAEQDGSLEVVNYAPAWRGWKSGDPMPLSNVIRHTLVPGANQQVISHVWQWQGINNRDIKDGDTYSSTCMLDTGTSEAGPFTRRTWTRKNGVDVLTQEVEETPGVARQITNHTYPDSIVSTDAAVKFRLATQPISTTVTTQDLRPFLGDDPAP